MLYFEQLPIINYNSIDFNQLTIMRNIFFRLDIKNINEEYLKFYRINGHTRLDTLSFELYGTTDYWWIIAIINDIKDIMFDIPLDEEILKQVATDRAITKYGSIEAVGALTYRSAQYDELVQENDDKRLIRVIDVKYIGRIITEILKSI